MKLASETCARLLCPSKVRKRLGPESATSAREMLKTGTQRSKIGPHLICYISNCTPEGKIPFSPFKAPSKRALALGSASGAKMFPMLPWMPM